MAKDGCLHSASAPEGILVIVTLEPLPETVDTLLEAIDRVIEDERARGQTLDAKTAQVTGFTGLILALDATLGRSGFQVLTRAPYKTLFPWLYVGAIVALTIAALAAVLGSLLPQKTLTFEREQLNDFADGDLILAETVPLKQTLIRTYAVAVSAESGRNSTKATALQVSAWALAIGLLAVAGQAVTLGLQQLHVY